MRPHRKKSVVIVGSALIAALAGGSWLGFAEVGSAFARGTGTPPERMVCVPVEELRQYGLRPLVIAESECVEIEEREWAEIRRLGPTIEIDYRQSSG